MIEENDFGRGQPLNVNRQEQVAQTVKKMKKLRAFIPALNYAMAPIQATEYASTEEAIAGAIKRHRNKENAILTLAEETTLPEGWKPFQEA